MKDLSPEDRPREKLSRNGVAVLGDNELVALVLGHGSRQGGALSVANTLLRTYGGIHGLARCSVDELSRVAGIGHARAAQISAALELGRRTLIMAPPARLRIRHAADAALYLMPRFGSRAIEQFGVLMLDTKYRVMRVSVLASGTQNSTVVEPRDVYRAAMLGGAAAIVAFHNHPSGDPLPSAPDLDLTHRLRSAGVLMGIELVDHLILGESTYFSFVEMSRS